MSHAIPRLNEYGRSLIVERVLAGHKPGEVAKQAGVSRQTVYKWVRRFKAEGPAGLADRSSRPHSSPTRTSKQVTARIVKTRLEHFAGPVVLAGLLQLPASTIGAVLRREQVPLLRHLDRVSGEVIKGRRYSDIRYEHDQPGSLLHIDVKKIGKIPMGGGWRVHGRSEKVRGRGNGWDYIHVAIDDHSRVAYCEVLPDEKGTTCAGFLHRAAQWFREQHGVTIRRVLTDNAKNYTVSADWIAVCAALQIKRLLHQAPLPLDQRQGREVQPHPADRVGLQPHLDLQPPAHPRPGQLPQALQHSTRPLSPRRQAPDQPHRSVNNLHGRYT